MMQATNQIKRWYEYTLAATIACFCFSPKSITLFIIVLIAFTVYSTIKKETKFVFTPILYSFSLLYLAYVIGVFFTDHFQESLGYLERKLVLVLFPILFSFRFKERIDLRVITIGFVVGIVVLTVLSVINGIHIYSLTHDFNNSFGSSSYSYIHHPTYFAAMCTISLLLVREGKRKEWKYFNSSTLFLYFLLTCANLLFCFSFASLIFFFLLLVISCIQFCYKRLSFGLFSLFLICTPLIPIAAYFGNVHVQIEVDGALKDAKDFIQHPDGIYDKVRTNPSGNQTRLLMWTVSAQEFAAHPFGSGTANFDDKLGKRLIDKGLPDYAELKYNPHNQFLQVAVEIGIIGLLIFIGIIVWFIAFAKKFAFGILIWLTANLAFNCLFESMFQRQSGIVFYVFFMCLFVSYLSGQIPVKTKKMN